MLRKTSIPSEYKTCDVRVFTTRMLLNNQSNRYHPLDGQLIPRSSDIGLFNAINAGIVPVCTDAEWLADPSKRGMYTLGDGKTTIRLPDWNGKLADSLGAPVIRGDGKNSEPVGVIQGDGVGRHAHNLNLSSNSFGGAKKPADPLETSTAETRGLHFATAIFDTVDKSKDLVRNEHRGSNTALAGSSIGKETRMVNTAGVYAVRR